MATRKARYNCLKQRRFKTFASPGEYNGGAVATLLRHQKYIPWEEQRELLIRAKDGDMEAEGKVICANLALVARIARCYRRRGVESCDLIQAGVLGLIRAVRKFDVTKNFRLTTYASIWIRRMIREYIDNCDHGYAARVPIPTIAKVRAAKKRGETDTSLDHLRTPKVFGQFTHKHYSHDFHQTEDRDHCNHLLRCLNAVEKRVIILHYGLNGNGGFTLREIAGEMGVSYQRVAQIHNKAAVKLKAVADREEEACCGQTENQAT